MRLVMVVIVASVAIAVACGWLVRQPGASTEPPATTATQSEASSDEWDFGPISQDGGPVSHVFQVSNKSPASWKLSVLSKSCGCADVELPRSVPPFGTAAVKVTVDPARTSGPFRERVRLSGDTAACPEIEYVVVGDAIPAAHVEPDCVEFAVPGASPENERTVEVTLRLERGAVAPEAPQMETDCPAVRSRLVESDVPPGKAEYVRRARFRFALTLDQSAVGVEAAKNATHAAH